MRQRERLNRIKLGVLFGILLLLLFLSLFLGRMEITPKQLVGILFSRFADMEKTWTTQQESIVWNTRIPRVLLAALVGGCLSAAGASYQGIFRNPMAAPDVLGASAGAALGASLAIVMEWNGRIIMLCAFSFSILTVAIVCLVSRLTKGNQVLGLVLAGMMLSSLCSAGTSFIKLIADTQTKLPEITYWLMGSLNGVKMEVVKFAVLPMLVGLLPLLVFRWRINILTLGDSEAVTMGVDAKKIRFISIACATLVTAASVAVSGMIGWVGLVIPHLARRLVGNDYRYLMPASILFGGSFLLVVDDLARNLLNTELPLGILNAVIGVPFFIYLLTRKEGVQ